MMLTLGLLDGMRVIFYYSQIQEAAREGARWATVQVARQVNGNTPWGTFQDTGNASGSYCQSGCDYTLIDSRAITTTAPATQSIVGAVAEAATAVDLNAPDTTIDISTTIPSTATEQLQTDDLLTNVPVTVTVRYSFRPILGMVFGGVTIPLEGTSVMLHE